MSNTTHPLYTKFDRRSDSYTRRHTKGLRVQHGPTPSSLPKIVTGPLETSDINKHIQRAKN